MQEYDLIVIGGGPAGLTAALYGARFKFKTLLFEGGIFGGQLALTTKIENYPGFEIIEGPKLSELMKKQAEKFGTEFKMEKVNEIKVQGEHKIVISESGSYLAKAIIIATGAAHRKLGLKGEDEFIGKGVSYCATCDALFFKGKDVAVIGGGSSALTAALHLAEYAKKVYIIHRRDEFRGEPVLVERIDKKGVEKVLCCTPEEIKGDGKVSSLVVKNTENNEIREIPLEGVFIYVGVTPTSVIAQSAGVAMDEKGYIKVNNKMETNVPGIFACGDVTGGVLQVANAVGEGCTAGWYASPYIRELKKK